MVNKIERKIVMPNNLVLNNNFTIESLDTYEVSFNFYEMKKIIMSETQFNNSIKLLLNEELHISDDVINAYIYVKNEILNDLSKTQIKKGILPSPFKKNEIVLNVFNCDLSINYSCYYLTSNDDIGKIISNLNLVSHIDNSNKKLTLNFINIDGISYDPRYFDDALQHELEHFYQFIKKGGTDLIPNNKLYKIALKYLDSKENDGFNQMLANIIYLSYKQEWDGFINGSFAMLSACDIRTIGDFNYYFEMTEAYRTLQNLRYFQEILNENETNELLLKAINEVSSKTLKWYKRVVDYSIKNISKKLNGIKKLYLKNKDL